MLDTVDAVVTAAESEVKYWGGSSVGLLHLAIALAKRDPEAFAAGFGDDGVEAVKRQLAAGRFGDGDPNGCSLVLEAGRLEDNTAEAHRAMVDALRKQLDWVFQPDSEPEPHASSSADTATPAEDRATPVDRPRSGPPPEDTYLVPLAPAAGVAPERLAQVNELVVMLARTRPLVPLMSGRPGSGRSTLLSSFAARVSDTAYTGPLSGIDVVQPQRGEQGTVNHTYQLRRAVEQLRQPTVICIEDLEVLLGVSRIGMDLPLLSALRQLIEHPMARFVFSIDESVLGQLSSMVPEFVAELTSIDVALGPGGPIVDIVAGAAAELAQSHIVTIPREVVEVAASLPSTLGSMVQPGLGISSIDSACVRAVLRDSDTVEPFDLRRDEAVNRRIDYDGLCESLRRHVVGQDQVIGRIASRLALTQAGLDLRPERPDGVFLFVGPTGVGKTEMARAISREVFGHEDRMIRLDMSEYVHEWAVSRLIGPQPGYVGSDEPGSWLTTKVSKTPACVLLLDEIEKAHPLVWNTFLQVFDAGRLTDSRGETVNFSRVVVVMTSNLGAEAYSKRHVGFGEQATRLDDAESAVSETIRRSLSPELLNRLDDVLMFRPLGMDAIREIARAMVDEQLQRIAALGYQLSVEEAVIEHLASTGYEPVFGARHLQRNVDRQLLVPLALAGAGTAFRAELDGEEISWEPIGA